MMPDLEKIAETYGLPVTRITDAGELTLICDAMTFTGPQLIDIRLAPNETLEPKVAAIPQLNGGMLSMPLEDMSPLLPLEEFNMEMLIPLSDASLLARKIVPDRAAREGK
jgi:acetolactate synthase-1/2/3 large subunit